jgi:hypothetical protein
MADIVLNPPVAATELVHGEQTLSVAQTLTAIRVEMPGGRSLELRARRPDGGYEPLLWIKNVRPEWQTPFVLRHPVTLPRGSVLQAIGRFEPGATARQLRVTFNAYAAEAARQHAIGVKDDGWLVSRRLSGAARRGV